MFEKIESVKISDRDFFLKPVKKVRTVSPAACQAAGEIVLTFFTGNSLKFWKEGPRTLCLKQSPLPSAPPGSERRAAGNSGPLALAMGPAGGPRP